MSSSYQASNITVLNDLEAVRLRPGMYIGNTGKQGLQRCFGEIIDNSMDEFMACHCSEIRVRMLSKSKIMVADNGRGIPVEVHPETGLSTVETIFAVLHAGGKFDQNNYKFSGGLHGVGASVVNFLSKNLDCFVLRDNKIYHIGFEKGVCTKPIYSMTGKEFDFKFPDIASGSTWSVNGTIVVFEVDDTIFETVEFEESEIRQELEDKAFLNKGLKIYFDHIRDLDLEKKSENKLKLENLDL